MTKIHRLGKAWGRFLTKELLDVGYFKETRDFCKIRSYIKINKARARKMHTPKEYKRKKSINIQK